MTTSEIELLLFVSSLFLFLTKTWRFLTQEKETADSFQSVIFATEPYPAAITIGN